MKILKVKPYNDLWIDCVDNNLIGILSAYEKKFNNFPCFYNSNYEITIKGNCNNNLSSHLDISFTRPDLTRIFEEKLISVNLEDNIEELIQYLLNDNFYIFLNIDRFYFPGSPDFNKNSFIHPTFIYGYNKRGYKLLEDCIKSGIIDYYEINNENFVKSFKSTFKSTNKITIHCVRLKDDWRDLKFEVSKDFIISSLNKVLESQKYERGGEICYKGLISIKKYAELFDEENPQMLIKPDHFLSFYKQIKRTVTLQKRNLILIKNISKANIINEELFEYLINSYSKQHNQWEAVANKLGWIMYKNSKGTFIAKSKEIKESLLELYNSEHDLTTKFLEAMQT